MINLEKSVKVDNWGRHVGSAYRTGRFVHLASSFRERVRGEN